MAQGMIRDLSSFRLVSSSRRLDSIPYFLTPTTITATVFTPTSSHQLSSVALPSPRLCVVHSTSSEFSSPVPSTGSDVDAGGETEDNEAGGGSLTNQQVKKRKAPRSVRWARKLASFNIPQIEQIVRVAALGEEVLDALMLVKSLGPEDRDEKRRELNFIGKLLRDAEPDLLDGLIQATKDDDLSMIETLSARKEQEDQDEEEVSTTIPWNEVPPNSFRRMQNSLYCSGFSLGVDLGLSRTGIAISKGFSIQPLKVLELRGQKLEQMLLSIAKQREVDEFIIGLPTSYDGTENSQSNKVRSVAGRIAALAAERGWRVYLQGEYGTSSDAMQMMIDRGLSKSSRQQNLDSYAAMVVLERYFSTSGKNTELVWPRKLELQEKLRSAARGINLGELEDFD